MKTTKQLVGDTYHDVDERENVHWSNCSNREYNARITDNIEAERDCLEAVNAELVFAFQAAIERMEAVAERIPVKNRAPGVSQALHVAHMAGHLAAHAKIARTALSKASQ